MNGWPEEWRMPQFDSLRLIRQVGVRVRVRVRVRGRVRVRVRVRFKGEG